MKALVFAAGLGTRLKPWTDLHPKALAPVAGEAMLGRVIKKIKTAGITNIVVNVHHFADQIERYLHENDNFDVDIRLSDESELLLDTGGGLLKAVQLLGDSEPVLIHNADILSDFSIEDMSREALDHKESMATLLVKERATQRYLIFGDDNRMRGWINTGTRQIRPEGAQTEGGRQLAFGGVHIVKPEIFKALAEYNESLLSSSEPGKAFHNGICKFPIMDFYIDTCRTNCFSAYESKEPYNWFDIGKADTLEAAGNYFSQYTSR